MAGYFVFFLVFLPRLLFASVSVLGLLWIPAPHHHQSPGSSFCVQSSVAAIRYLLTFSPLAAPVCGMWYAVLHSSHPVPVDVLIIGCSCVWYATPLAQRESFCCVHPARIPKPRILPFSCRVHPAWAPPPPLHTLRTVHIGSYRFNSFILPFIDI